MAFIGSFSGISILFKCVNNSSMELISDDEKRSLTCICHEFSSKKPAVGVGNLCFCNNEKALSGKKTIAKYNLGTSGSVVKIRKKLIDKEVIDNHNKTIEFIDPLFKLWFKNRYMR